VLSGTLAGRITYENEHYGGPVPTKGVPEVTVTADSSIISSPDKTDITSYPVISPSDIGGLYTMTGFGPGQYVVTPSRTAYACGSLSGIDLFDATLVAQHIVGLITLTPTQLRAGKVSNTADPISSFDAGLIAQCWVQAPTSLVNRTGQWKFTDAVKTYPDMNPNRPNENYVGLLLGDVSGDWTPETGPIPPPALMEKTAEKSDEDAVRASLPVTNVAQGGSVTVPFKIENLRGRGVVSYQFEVQYDPAVVRPADVAADLAGTLGSGLSVVSNSPEPGRLRVGVFGITPVTGDGSYVDLKFVGLGALGTSTSLTIREFGVNDGSTGSVVTDGQLTIGSAASSNATISGRVLSQDGRGVRNAQVMLTNSSGAVVQTSSGPRGTFQFGNLTMGETYTLTVVSRRFAFQPRSVAITDSAMMGIDLIGEGR
jgi:hypothetical protein